MTEIRKVEIGNRTLYFDDYVYRFVAVTLGGEPNTKRIKEMVDRGWEPVPDGEWPDDIPRAETNGLTPPSLVLYRCPGILAHEREQARLARNALEQDPATHVARANDAIDAYVGTLPPRADGKPANHGWSRIQGSGTVVGPTITVVQQTSRHWRAD